MIIVSQSASSQDLLPSTVAPPDWSRFYVKPQNFNRNRAFNLTQSWLSQDYSQMWDEWCYQGIPPRLMIEELLRGDTGVIPNDYKFFMFDGKCEVIQVDSDRFGIHTRDLFDARWVGLDISFGSYAKSAVIIPKPEDLSEMILIAEKLSQDLDFVRVDLYRTDSGIKFGELTNYPEAGKVDFVTESDDNAIGSRWNPKY